MVETLFQSLEKILYFEHRSMVWEYSGICTYLHSIFVRKNQIIASFISEAQATVPVSTDVFKIVRMCVFMSVSVRVLVLAVPS